MPPDTWHVVIEAEAPVHEWAAGLDVSTDLDDDGRRLVWGPDLDAFLARLDPDVWDPARARGDS